MGHWSPTGIQHAYVPAAGARDGIDRVVHEEVAHRVPPAWRYYTNKLGFYLLFGLGITQLLAAWLFTKLQPGLTFGEVPSATRVTVRVIVVTVLAAGLRAHRATCQARPEQFEAVRIAFAHIEMPGCFFSKCSAIE